MYRVTTFSRASRASRLAVAALALATFGATGDQAEARSRHHRHKATERAEAAKAQAAPKAQDNFFSAVFSGQTDAGATAQAADPSVAAADADSTTTGKTTARRGKGAATSGAPGTGIASFYGGGHHGGPTASGERFNQYAMTAAHRSAPLGSQMRVTNLNNGKSIVVRINDRGPFVRGRIIDVSKGAAQALGFVSAGLTRVKVEPMS